MTGAFVTENR